MANGKFCFCFRNEFDPFRQHSAFDTNCAQNTKNTETEKGKKTNLNMENSAWAIS